MQWLKNFNNAIEYIEENLEEDISYDEVAKAALCSTFYFQRIFSYVTGISLSEYIRRRRMTQAAFDLQRTNNKVIDIALKYGYSSPTSFNRAFHKVHGIAPMRARNTNCKLKAYPPIKFSVKITGEDFMSYHIEEKEEIRIVGVRTELAEDMQENQKIVPTFWKNILKTNIFKNICDLSNKQPSGILGISKYDNPKDIFYYIAASTNKPLLPNMHEIIIPASTWAVFENDGPLKESVQGIFRRFFTEWLPFCGYEYARLPDIEVYPIFQEEPFAGHSEVWFAIKKRDE